MDEASFYPDTLPDGSEPFSSIIMPITKARKPKILVISTPKGKRGMFYSLWNKALANEKGFSYIKATIYDDELVDEEEINRIKSLVSPLSFQEEFECQFLDSSLTFFNGFENCFTDFEYDNKIKQYIGVDLSATENGDDTIVTLINEKQQVNSITIKGSLDNKYKAIADIINNTNNLQGVYIEKNGVGIPIINEIEKLVKKKSLIHHWLTTNESKNEILGNLAVKIANKQLIFNNADTTLYSQFGTFIAKYTKTGKLQLEAQAGHHDDKIMSLAIALKCKEEERPNIIPQIAWGHSKIQFN